MWTKLAGMWLLCDAVFSLMLYVGKPNESWIRCHSIRIVRGLIGIAMMIKGGNDVETK